MRFQHIVADFITGGFDGVFECEAVGRAWLFHHHPFQSAAWRLCSGAMSRRLKPSAPGMGSSRRMRVSQLR